MQGVLDQSTDLQPPWLGPGLPVYPQVSQLLRVFSPSIGSNVYSCFVQQEASSLVLRDREAAYLWEPNGIALGSGYYDGRLIGNYLGLPLYVTNCCPTGVLPSLSSSISPTIQRDSLGSIVDYPVNSVTLPNITVATGALLVVVVAVIGNGDAPTVTFGATTLAADAVVSLPALASLQGRVACYSNPFVGGETHNIVATLPTLGVGAIAIQAVQVRNLPGNVKDQTVTASALVGSPDTGATGVTTQNNEYAQSAFAILVPGGAWAWQNGFASGGQDLNESVGGIATAVTEGYRILSAAQAVDAALGGVTPSAWAGLVVTYK